MPKSEISAVVLTLNEEENIRSCLKSLEWCDEIVVVDGYSDDRTVEIAGEYTDKIYQKEQEEPGFDHLRAIGIDKSEGDWILKVDADEVVPLSLAEKLRKKSRKDSLDVVEVPKKHHVFGKWLKHTSWWPNFRPVMFRPEKVELSPRIFDWIHIKDDVNVERLEANEELALVHLARKDLSDCINHANKYSSIDAKQNNKDYSVLKTLTKPFTEFFKVFFLEKGYKEGLRGFMWSMVIAYQSQLTELKKLEKALLGTEEDFREEYRNHAYEVLDS